MLKMNNEHHEQMAYIPLSLPYEVTTQAKTTPIIYNFRVA